MSKDKKSIFDIPKLSEMNNDVEYSFLSVFSICNDYGFMQFLCKDWDYIRYFKSDRKYELLPSLEENPFYYTKERLKDRNITIYQQVINEMKLDEFKFYIESSFINKIKKYIGSANDSKRDIVALQNRVSYFLDVMNKSIANDSLTSFSKPYVFEVYKQLNALVEELKLPPEKTKIANRKSYLTVIDGYSVNYQMLLDLLKDYGLIENSTKITTLKNIFKENNKSSKIKWIGKVAPLCYLLDTLWSKKIITKNSGAWKDAELIFIQKDGTPFKKLLKSNGKSLSKEMKPKIDNLIDLGFPKGK